MKNKIITLVIITTMLLLVACTNEQVQTSKGIYIGGTQGITAKFEQLGVAENGIYSIFDTETFPIEVTVTNKGEYDIKPSDITVTLLGPSQTEFSDIKSWQLKNTGSIEKISELIPNGGQETITFTSNAKYTAPVTGVTQRTWLANIDYYYETYTLVPEACLKEDPTDKRVCEITGAKEFATSSGPLTITTVTEEQAGKGIMALKFHVKNAGTGRVAKPTNDFAINDEFTFSLDDTSWDCKSGGKINEGRLTAGETDVVCKLKNPLAKGTLATKQVKLTLNYKYRDIIQEKLQIKQSVK
jgi:hypothetical protein